MKSGSYGKKFPKVSTAGNFYQRKFPIPPVYRQGEETFANYFLREMNHAKDTEKQISGSTLAQ